jgi:threonine synthase
VDGIDVCIVDFQEPVLASKNARDVHGLDYNCLAFKTFAWPGHTRERILAARDGLAGPGELAKLNYELANVFGDVALQLLDEVEIPLSSVQLVSSHGQSIVGHPHWELGDINVIAQRTGIATCGDFRPADVAVGGNGSPCTCTFDSIMLRPPEGATAWRTCINIGGTTSMTFCPPRGSSEAPVGLDPGIGVFFMDLNAQAVLGKPYDENGDLARSGKLSEALLAVMLQHPHYQRSKLPISIGAEDFPRPLFATWRTKSQQMGLCDADFQATLVELTTRSLAMAAARFGPAGKISCRDVVVRGGVRFNSFFMERLKWNFCNRMNASECKLTSIEDLGMSEDSWETVMYAMFGFLCHRGLNNFVPSCTGAGSAVCGGKLARAGPILGGQVPLKPMLKCLADGENVNPCEQLGFCCRRRCSAPEMCHLLVPNICDALWRPRVCRMVEKGSLELNPFARFRERLFPYRVARTLGLTDADWLKIVEDMDNGLRRVEPEGNGFRITPLKYFEELKVWAKDESHQVGQSHKARHFANIMFYLQALVRSGAPVGQGLCDRPLAVASCGNAALGAATVAAAMNWPILVFIPDDAEPAVVRRLEELHAKIKVCPKAENAKVGGDATVYHFRKAVEGGAIPFSVQASDNGIAAEGSSTLIWEALEQLYEKGVSELGSVVVHVGGGALASGIFSGLEYADAIGILPRVPTFHTVQGEGCAPLHKCFSKLMSELYRGAGDVPSAQEVNALLEAAVKSERSFMEVWPDPTGAAHGIMDDETYDWAKLSEAMLRTGGGSHKVSDELILQSWQEARAVTGINMCTTGACGYAGVQKIRSKSASCLKEPTLIIFSGMDRSGV